MTHYASHCCSQRIAHLGLRRDVLQADGGRPDAQGEGSANDPTSVAEDAFVDVRDTVTHCFLDKPRDRHVVYLIEGAVNGMPGVATMQAPLSIALLGLTVGEVGVLSVKGQRDRLVRVIKIERLTIKVR